MKKIVLFYKRLVKPGGAERLLLKEYQYFKSKHYKTKIVCFEYNDSLEFDKEVDPNDIITFNKKNTVKNIFSLITYLKNNNDALYLCNSGYIDFYIASAMSNTDYSLHIHQPSFMSFNEKDKYSVFIKKAFEKLANSNYGAKRFLKIKEDMSLKELFYCNLRSIISINAVKKAKDVFVLSDYAKNEKKEMYGITAHNFSGALENDIFSYKANTIKEFQEFKYKLISIARLDRNKRLDELIMGFSNFLQKKPNSILLIGGTGDEFDNLNTLIKDLNIEKNVRLLGFVPDELLYDYYAWADLFVSIDWADFRITSYEAMAVGTKVLLSNETDPNEELLSSGYYYLCEPTQIEVEKEIERSLENNKLLEVDRLKELLKNYTWESYFTKIEKVLNA